ncbi:hypothetical protein LCGC14_2225270, partial [marine sediment metagenome]
DPCYAFVNFTAQEDIFIYPLDYDPYNRNIGVNFDPNVKDWKIERSWGSGWREIDLNDTCKGTWCGGKFGAKSNVYSFAFREGRDYQIRITVLKNNPDENVKWSAFGVDPTFFGLNNQSLDKKYNKSNREISFDSKIDNSTELKIKLGTDLIHYVIYGSNRTVAITNIENNYGDYPLYLILGPVEFINLETNQTFKRDYHYEYKKSNGFKVIDDYIEICVNETIVFDSNSSETVIQNCNRYLSGWHPEEQFEWVYLDISKDMPKGKLTVALVTDVLPYENVEWIPTILGSEITEWAEWTESLNVDIVAYYKLDEASGATAFDSLGDFDGTNTGADVNQNGIINKSYFFGGGADNVNVGDLPISTSLTTSLWINASTVAQFGTMIQKSPVNSQWIFFLDTTVVNLRGGNTASDIKCLIGNLTDNNWHNIVFVTEGSNGKIFIDGSKCVDDTITPIANGAGDVLIGKHSSGGPITSLIDEVGIWNRTLSDSEINDLYNGGVGITYTSDFNLFPAVTLNSPVDNFNLSSQSITFNGTATDDINLINVSLILDSTYNETNTTGLNNSNYIFSPTTISEGTHNWTYEACDDSSLCTTATVKDFRVDLTAPTIEYVSPT